MCSHPCLLPTIRDNLCPVHYVSKFKVKILETPMFLSDLEQWVGLNYYDEVFFRNQALNHIYGSLPSYAYFTSEDQFVETDYVDWWKPVLKDCK